MIKAPFRNLTVTCGRDVLGTITQQGSGRFIALLPSGEKLGIYGTAADAAQAINTAQLPQPSTTGVVR